MSMWVASSVGPTFRPRTDRVALPAGVAVLVGALALLVWQARFRVGEAWVTAAAMRLFRLRPASSLGDNVVFPLHGRFVGFTLTTACTAALLMVPFFLVVGLLLVARRVDSRRALVALAVTAAVIFVVNQLRLLVIAGSMLVWGFQTGYERSHVFLGTVLSTIGVVTGVIIFVWMLVGGHDRHGMESNKA
jgi:exosortase/archaeosortase family protein